MHQVHWKSSTFVAPVTRVRWEDPLWYGGRLVVTSLLRVWNTYPMNIRINFSPWFPKSSIVTPKGSTPMVWYGKRRSSCLTGNIWLCDQKQKCVEYIFWGRFIIMRLWQKNEHLYFLFIDKPVLSADVRAFPSCSPTGRKQKGDRRTDMSKYPPLPPPNTCGAEGYPLIRAG